jgi:hypothetical protein
MIFNNVILTGRIVNEYKMSSQRVLILSGVRYLWLVGYILKIWHIAKK